MPRYVRKPAGSPSSTPPLSSLKCAAASSVRINKALASAGLCSRRKAEELVLAGRVRVNGVIRTELAHKVDLARDRIEVDGSLLKATQDHTYILLHKPVQVMCTLNDPQGRTTIMDILPREFSEIRVYPVGRLDYFSEGLLLLTDDGELAQRLAHPRHHLPKKYEVLLRGPVPEAAITVMRRGMTLAEGEKLAPVGVRRLPSVGMGGQVLLQMTLRQGLNRQIRRMCRDLGLTILKLKRVAQGPLELGSLALGKARQLTDTELADLRNACGLA